MELDTTDHDDVEAHEAPVAQCKECGNVSVRWPDVYTRGETVRLYCPECMEMAEHLYSTDHRTPEETTAMLAALTIQTFGGTDRVEVAGRTVKVWINGGGINLSNVERDMDLRTSEVGPIGTYNHATRQKAEDTTEVFTTLIANGVRDDYEGYGLPTHTPRKDGAYLKEDMDDAVAQLADIAGVDLSGE